MHNKSVYKNIENDKNIISILKNFKNILYKNQMIKNRKME
jgi:hypothetical protein